MTKPQAVEVAWGMKAKRTEPNESKITIQRANGWFLADIVEKSPETLFVPFDLPSGITYEEFAFNVFFWSAKGEDAVLFESVKEAEAYVGRYEACKRHGRRIRLEGNGKPNEKEVMQNAMKIKEELDRLVFHAHPGEIATVVRHGDVVKDGLVAALEGTGLDDEAHRRSQFRGPELDLGVEVRHTLGDFLCCGVKYGRIINHPVTG